MDLKYVCQQYFTCMCFLGFIRYNKSFMASGKYENINFHIEALTTGWMIPSGTNSPPAEVLTQ
jgi:hypothetical protein